MLVDFSWKKRPKEFAGRGLVHEREALEVRVRADAGAVHRLGPTRVPEPAREIRILREYKLKTKIMIVVT